MTWTPGRRRSTRPSPNWLNARHGRLGAVFAERPAAYLVPTALEVEVLAYIHNNPVRAKLVAKARRSTWSSHQAYVGLRPAPEWLDVREGLARAGCADAPERFDVLVDALVDVTIELPDLRRARADARRLGALEIGTPTLSSPPELPIVSRPYVRARVTVTALLGAVAGATGVPIDEMARRHARGEVAMVKKVVIHAAIVMLIPVSAVSAAINISRQRGSVVAQMSLSRAELALVKKVVRLLGGG